MERKTQNILSVFFSIALSCIMIPVGIKKDWSITELAIGIASLLIAGLVVTWNNEGAFQKSSTKIHFGYHLLGSICFTLGFLGILGSLGDSMLPKALGAVLTISGAIIERLSIDLKK